MENTKKYNHEHVDFDEKQVVYLKEFIIFEQTDTKDKFAIFKFFNNYIEELNNVEFLIKQYDVEGNLIAENTLKYSNFKADKKSDFSPYTKLMVEDECHRVEAVLIKATFKTRHFEDNKLSTLKDLDSIKNGLKPSKKERNKVKVKRIKNKNKIKYFLLAPFLAIALLVSIILTFVSVNNFKENLTSVSDENFHYTIINNEAIVDKYLNSDTNVTIVSDIFGYKVTKIKEDLFLNSNVESVTIKASKIEIGENAFRNCSALDKISFNTITSVGDYAFYGCSSLESLNFKKIEKIGNYAFANTGITKVESETVTEIGNNAFENCNKIEKIDVINATIGINAFSSELVIEEISIGDFEGSIGSIFGISTLELANHFNVINCKPLTIETGDFDSLDFSTPKVNIDFSIATIQYQSMVEYFDISNIQYIDTGYAEIVNDVLISVKDTNLTILNNDLLNNSTVTSISPGVIAGIPSNHAIIDISGVTIDENTLSRSKLTSLEIGEAVLVDNDTFNDNQLIKELTLYGNPNNNYSTALKNSIVESIIFKGTLVPSGYFEGLRQIKSINFEENVEIGDNAFNGCIELAVIDFSHIISIGSSAFKSCEKIVSISFNPNIKEIGENAFKDCKNLEYINSLPESVNVRNAFTGENKIKDLVIFNYGVSISDIGNFKVLENLTIKSNYNYDYLVSNLVSGLANLKSLELPLASSYQENIVNNCKNLKFIDLYTSSNLEGFIGKGCDSLYYVTINSDIDVSYSSFNKSAEHTKNLYINGKASNQFNLVGAENINYLKLASTDAQYLGDLFNAPSSENQTEYVPVSLKTVEIGNIRIESGFFNGCSYLHNIILPNATSLDSDALSGLYSIRNIYFGSNSINYTSFAEGFNADEHVYTPNILGNSLIVQNLKTILKDVNYITVTGTKTYYVYNENAQVGSFESVLVCSIDEILDKFAITGSLTFEKNSNTPINVNYYSSGDKIYQFEPEEVTFESYYSSPIVINYHYVDKNGLETVKTVNYDYNTTEKIKYFVPECKDLFAGWYTDEGLTSRFDFENEKTISTSLDLYAKQVNQSNVYTNNTIDDLYKNGYFYSTTNATVEILIYGDAGVTCEISGKKYNANEKIVLEIKAHTLYEIMVNSNSYVEISIIFSNRQQPVSNVSVEVKEKSFKNFKLSGSSISNYDLPKIEGYELLGWYDSKGDLVIDKYGNVYKYTSTKVYAKWVYVTE